MALQSGAPPLSWGSQSCRLQPPTASRIRAGSRWGVCVSVFSAARDRQCRRVRSCLAAERTGRRRSFPQTHLRRGCASVLAAASFWNRIPQVWALPFIADGPPSCTNPGKHQLPPRLCGKLAGASGPELAAGSPGAAGAEDGSTPEGSSALPHGRRPIRVEGSGAGPS